MTFRSVPAPQQLHDEMGPNVSPELVPAAVEVHCAV